MPGKTLNAAMRLPKGAKDRLSAMMRGTLFDDNYVAPAELPNGTPLAMFNATYDDGVAVAMGVLKGPQPEFNNIFAWVFCPDGTMCPGFRIDVSDHEEFCLGQIVFSLSDAADADRYVLEVREE